MRWRTGGIEIAPTEGSRSHKEISMQTLVPLTLRLNSEDRRALLAHFLSLDAEDRRLRFGASISDTVIRDYVARLSFGRDGFFAVRDAHGRIIAAAHVAITESSAELGISVAPEHRSRGNGGALFARAVDFLRNRGIREVFVHCLAENAAMRHLAARHGMRLSSQGSESEGRLTLLPATPESHFREWLHDQQAAVLEILRRNGQLAHMLWTMSRQ
jgi:RimJ/RimL family protein N-acetyltransferase